MIISGYTDDQIENVIEHCRTEVEAMRVWATNVPDEWQEKMSMEAVVFANDVFCQPVEVQVDRLVRYFHQRSHLESDGVPVYPHVMDQWRAAMNGQTVEGEFGFFSRLYPTDDPTQNFRVSPPGL